MMAQLRLVAVGAVILLLIGLGGFAWWQHRRAEALAADLALARQEAATQRLIAEDRADAARVLSAHVDKLMADAAHYDDINREIEEVKDADGAPGPATAAALRRLQLVR